MTNQPEPDTEHVLRQWRLWQEAQRLSDRTITERASTIRHLLEASDCGPLTITPEAIILFCGRKFRHDGQPLKPNSAATFHATIRAYCKWLVATDRRLDDPTAKTPRPKRVRTPPRPVTDAQLAQVVAVVRSRRAHMMVLLAALAALREHEIAKFHGSDIDRINGVITVTGKGGDTAVTPADDAIIEFANLHPDLFPEDGYWFASYTKQHGTRPHVTRGAVYGVLSRALRRAGISGTPHQFRHWYGSTLIDLGVDVRIVQEMLRHKSITSTQIYTLVHLRQMKAAQARLRLPQLDLAA